MKQIFLDLLHGIYSGWYWLPAYLLIAVFFIVVNRINGWPLFFKNDGKLDDKEKSFLKSFLWSYPIWGTVQHLMIICVYFLFDRAFNMPINLNIVLCGIIFAIFHTANIFLILATFGLSMALLLHFDVYHNLLFMGIVHGYLATVLKFMVPPRVSTAWVVFRKVP